MPYSNIEKPSKYFEPVLYTGNNANNRTINTTENFQADLFWIKARSTGASHILNDILRSSGYLLSNATSAEGAYSSLSWTNTAPASTGFSIDYGSNGSINGTGTTFVSWCWKANGTGVSNTSGTISSTVSANTTAGFSIVSWTGNGSNSDQTLGTGLSTALDFIIAKPRDNGGNTDSWVVYASALNMTQNQCLLLESTSAFITGATSGTPNRGSTAGQLKLLAGTVSNQNLNASGLKYIAYCFHNVKGFSKFGKYTGNGSTNGTFVYTGFKPSFVMAKASSVGGYSWAMSDNKRNPFNQANNTLYANASDAEYTSLDQFDLLSNGFKLRSIYGNTTGDTYIYMAFAENPFCSSKGIACTAR